MSALSIIVANIILITCFFCDVVVARQPTDDVITKEIKSLLTKEADIPTKRLNISANDGVVLLDGTVDTRLQAHKIIEIANSVDNVRDVDTYNLKVASSNQYLKDSFITSAAKGKIILLARNGKIGKDINFSVETTNGKVHIFGKIEDDKDISVITREVGRIKGVKDVHCNTYS